MTENAGTIERFMDGLNKSDHEQVLSCLTDDMVWEMQGLSRYVGKEAIRKSFEHDDFEEPPVITVTRMTEQNDVVIAEGTVLTKPKGAPAVTMVFCDVCEMRGGKISKLIGYIVERK